MPILAYASEIKSAVMLVHGEKAHSYYFSKDAFAKLKGTNKKVFNDSKCGAHRFVR